MITAATPATMHSPHTAEVLEVAIGILEHHRDEHLARKSAIVQGFLEMSQRYPERDYRATLNRALADLSDAVYLHLNAEGVKKIHAETIF